MNVKSVLCHATLPHYTGTVNTGRYSFCKVTNILPVRGKLTDDVKDDGNVARMGKGFMQSSDRKCDIETDLRKIRWGVDNTALVPDA